MESLSLTPAESLMIVSPNVFGDKMIRFTLMDLILRKHLKINIGKSDILKRSYDNIVISEGELSESFFKPHEDILMQLILEHRELKLKKFVEALYKKIDSPLKYKNKYVRDPLVDKGYFKKQRKMLLALAPYTIYTLTNRGTKTKSKIMKLLDEAEYLEKWMKEDLGRAKAYLSVLGSHILLLNDYDIDDIKKFNRILSFIKPESNTGKYYDYYLYDVPSAYLDEFGNLKSFDFLDISLFDYFNSFDDALVDLDDTSDDVKKNMDIKKGN